MALQDNVRRRRRERIEQIVGQAVTVRTEPLVPERLSELPRTPAYRPESLPEPGREQEPDPELWWKNYQREQQRQSKGARAPIQSLLSTGNRTLVPSNKEPSSYKSYALRFAQGFAVRLLVAAILYGACWGLLQPDMPGSKEARLWAVSAVTQDMDYTAIEAWYASTFGGSPSFLPMLRGKPSQEVSAEWALNATVLPAEGRIVQTFAQNKTGVRIAAAEGSGVLAVHTGRVTQVTRDSSGEATILVQHANHIVTVYGNVDAPAVKPNDWVQAGQKLGQIGASATSGAAGTLAGKGTLYFAVKQNGKTLNPAEVVPFD